MESHNNNLCCTAVLGWRDTPTDAVQEYCEFLGEELGRHGIQLNVFRVAWPEKGWASAFQDLTNFAESHKDNWFLVQYTALNWSRRGFPRRVLKVIRILKSGGRKCAVVFHDSEPYPGNRWIDRIRRAIQIHTMRSAIKLADVAIFNVPVKQNPFLPPSTGNMLFIPVGANLPSPEKAWSNANKLNRKSPAVAVFSLSGGTVGAEETSSIADAMRYASEKVGPLRLTVLGRNSDTNGKQLKEVLAGTQVQVDVLGLLQPPEVVQVLGACDAMLFVRGPISTRRGSAIAGIACGLPVIGRAGWETGPPLTEAGVALVPEEDNGKYGPTLVRVLSDPAYRCELAERSREAQKRYFSWSAIAAQYAEALKVTQTKDG